MIEIIAVGGYLEVGRNMTAIKYKDEVILVDMGLHLENYILKTEDEDAYAMSSEELIDAGAMPDISVLKDWKTKVKAIVISHAHLDHLGAVPFLAEKFPNAPILCTTFSSCVLEEILYDNEKKLPNKIRVLSDNGYYQLSNNIRIEFINITHSTPDSVFILIHTPEGSVLYTCDFKFDDTPVIGKKPNYARIGELKNVKLLILDTLYASSEEATPSESVAKDMVQSAIYESRNKKNAVFVTTFSSHIARLRAIVDAAKQINRKTVFIGRSLAKYAYAAQNAGLARFPEEVEIVKYSAKARKKLRQIEKDGRHKYLVVCTGHQGEKKAVISKMVFKDYFHFRPNDCVIFSSSIIPHETNIRDRKDIEVALKLKKVKVFTDLHVSGHGHQYDQKKLVSMVKPEIVIPAHSTPYNANVFKQKMLEWKSKSKVIIMKEGDKISI